MPISITSNRHILSRYSKARFSVLLISISLVACGATKAITSNGATKHGPGKTSSLPNSTASTYTLYATLPTAGEIVPIDATSGRIGAPIPTPPFPESIAASPNGKLLLVGSFPEGSSKKSNFVTPVYTATDKAGKPIVLPGDHPSSIAFTPDGKTAWIALWGTSSIVPIDIKTLRVGAPISVAGPTSGIAITHDGHWALVGNFGSNMGHGVGTIGDTITPVNLLTRTAGAPIVVGPNPCDIAINQSDTVAYVTVSGSDQVLPVNLSTFTAERPITVGLGPEGIAFSKDGSTLLITVKGSPILSQTPTDGSLEGIDLASTSVHTIVDRLVDPWSILPSADGVTGFVSVTGTNNIDVVNLGAGQSTNAIALPSFPHEIVEVGQDK